MNFRGFGLPWCHQPNQTRTERHDERSSLEEEQKRQNVDPNPPIFLVLWITQWPRLAFGLGVSAHLFSVALFGVVYASGYDILPAKWDIMPMEIYHLPWLRREHAWLDRDMYPNRVNRFLPPNKYPSWDRAFSIDPLMLIYDAGDDNIFTKERLRVIQTIEQRLAAIPDFSSYCQATRDGTCAQFDSVLRFFDGTFSKLDSVFYDPNFTNIDNVLYAAYTYNATKKAFLFGLSYRNEIKRGSVFSTMTRSFVSFGRTIRRNMCSEKDTEVGARGCTKQKANYKDFMFEYMEPVLRSFEDRPELEFTYVNYGLIFRVAKRTALLDLALAAASMAFIFSCVWFHTGSLLVTVSSLIGIICSFVETNFVYRVIIGYTYFGYFHLIILFIILGVGVDDVFVIWDAWQITALQSYPSLAHRLSDAYRRAGVAMLVTSLTTAGAFMANVFSHILLTSSFGVFSAIIIMINYLSVITFIPTVIVIYHLEFESMPYPCSCCCANHKRGGSGEEMSGHATGTGSRSQSPNNHNVSLERSGQSAVQDNANDDPGPGQGTERRKPDKMVIFFRDYYFAVVTHKTLHWVIIAFFLSIVGTLGYFALQMEADNEEVQFFRKHISYTKAIDHLNYHFVPSNMDATATVYLVWGLTENDHSGCHFSHYNCHGKHGYDDTFDASSVAAQNSFVRVCEALFNFTDTEILEYAIRRDQVTGDPEIACFSKDLDRFLNRDAFSDKLNVTMPWDYNKTSAFIRALSNYYSTSHFDSNFKRFLDIPMTYWIWDKFRQRSTLDYWRYNTLLGEERDTYSTPILTNPFITVGNRIKYLAIAVNTTLKRRSVSFARGKPIVDCWEKFMEDQKKLMPPEMQSGFQTTTFTWHWLFIQQTISRNAIQGILLGLFLSCPVLIISTNNVIIGFLATFTISCVAACVLAIIPLGGYKMGVLESFNMTMLVGLAVDFVVHLAEGYHMSKYSKRRDRVQDTLAMMGVSVFSGFFTTCGASMFMLFARIQFFFEFGTFMVSCIGFSYVFAMGLFIPLMAIVGPQGDVGDLRKLLINTWAHCCRENTCGTSENSAAPLESYTPENTAAPLENNTPGNSAAPLENNSPGNSAAPLENNSPENSAAPLESYTPKNTAAPLQNDTPGNSAAPLENNTPGNSAAPLENNTPGNNAAPLENNPPGNSAAPLENNPLEIVLPLSRITPWK